MKIFKNSVIMFVSLFFLFSCASQKDVKKKNNPLKGTWRAVYSLPNQQLGIKSFTDSHFNWYYVTPKGLITSVGGGIYKITSDTHFVEAVNAAGPSLSFVGKNAEIDFVIKGDTLITKFTLVGNNYSEKWVKID